MTSATLTPVRKTNSAVLIHLAVSTLLTLFLFYIDEGYYNFNWMLKTWNWFAFFLYVGGILSGQLIMREIFLKKLQGKIKTILSFVLGIPFGFLVVVTFIVITGLLSSYFQGN